MDFEYLLFLQNLRAEAPNFINSLLLFISEFAAGSLPVVIIVVFYWCIDKRTGQRMGLCFAGATMVTQLIKNIACVYRPWKQDARLQIAPEAAATATGYSFPSGHATLAASFYGNLAAYLKKYSKWWILPCVLLTLLTAFARNWLGAHTPQDVLVGMMIALVVLLLSKYLLNWADGGKNRDWLLATIGIILSAAMLMYTSVKPYPMDVLPDGTLLVDPWDMVTDCYKAAGAMMGFCLGWVLERHFVGFDAKGAGKARMIRGVVGVALLLAVRKGMKAAGNLLLDAHWLGFAEIFGLMLFAIVLYPALFQWVERRKRFFTESWGSKQGIRRSPKSCTRKEHESATNPIAKRGQGAMPLAGSRDSVPCGVWGNAPTVPRPTNPKEAANKGAGSAASLPVTLRVRRRAPKLLSPQASMKNFFVYAFCA